MNRRDCLAVLFGVLLSFTLAAHTDLLLQIEQIDGEIAKRGESVERLLKRGDLYRRHEDFASAARDFNRARLIDPADERVDFYQGQLQLALGHGAKAEQLLARYLRSEPEHSKAWKLLGEAAMYQGEAAEAFEYFGMAIETTDTPSPALYRLRVFSALAAGDSHRSASIASVNAGLEKFGPEVTLLGLGADIELAGARPEKAATYLERVPAGVGRLSQWQQRVESLNCDADECRLQARQRLDDQVAAFVSGFRATYIP